MNCPPVKYQNVVIQELDEEILIYDLLKNKAFCLNKTSAMIWQECDGKKTVEEISFAVSKKSGTTVNENIVWLALNQFKTEELLEDNNKITTPFDGLSRREIVKKIGFASAIALPIISAVIAPTAVNAASASSSCSCPTSAGIRSRPNGCPCTNNNDCCTNSCAVLIVGVFGICRAGSIPAGGASCCVAVSCGNQPGCPCANSGGCASGACVGSGICQ